jgi:hypothetical protein
MRNPVSESVRLTKPLLLTLLLSAGFFYASAQQIKFGNSYINISKKTVGGTVQNGDTLEIRLNIWFPSDYNSDIIYFARYLDNIPTNTVLADDSLRLITNEGLTYKRWTLDDDTDPGTYLASPGAGEYNIRINLGRDATDPTNNTSTHIGGAGTIYTGDVSPILKDKPRVGGGVLVTTAFRVRVTGNIGDTITLGAGTIRFKTSNNSGSSTNNDSRTATQYKILITSNDPICPNSVGRNFADEAGGTFDSGTVQNRNYIPDFPIVGYTYRANVSPTLALNDGNYAILNNLSPWASTFQNAEKRPNCVTTLSGSPPPAASCANRMFNGHWDIIGDHTGSSTPAGNTPKAPGTMGGYMLVVNADYATLEAYRQTISGLCPNTSYEFSLWVKNVCTNCGIDSSGNSTYKPGVYPNLTFAIDDLDRYSSGQVDTLGWIKKGFLFRTSSSQTSITISVRNNASGGGGNDWAIDDIALVTCNPNLNLVPSGNAQVCYGSQVDISSTVNSFFNNYTYYRFERSTDNGATWSVAGSGSGTPGSVSGGYEYNAQLVPSFLADSGHHMNQYRFVVGSTPANLANPDCSFFATATIIVMVNNCSVILSTRDSLERLRRVVTRTGKHAEIRRLVNPFNNNISFDLIVAQDAPATFTVIDNFGRAVRQVKSKVLKGYNHVMLGQMSGLSNGMYFLRVETNNEILNKAVIKTN